MQVIKYANDYKGILPGFETHGRCHQKSEKGIPVAPKKD